MEKRLFELGYGIKLMKLRKGGKHSGIGIRRLAFREKGRGGRAGMR